MKFKFMQKKLLKKKKSLFILGGILFGLLILYLFFFSKSNPISYTFPAVSGKEEKEPERINVLMLGMAGGKHDGATLTDSIIVGSYHTKTKKVVLISIPRDLWIPSTEGKINAVYQTGLKDDRRSPSGKKALENAKKIIGEEVAGMHIDYAVRIDFSGFAKAIDQVGGIDINVPVTFDDVNFPVEGRENDLCGNKEEEIELTEEQAKVLKTTPGKMKVIVTPEGHIASTSAAFACRFEHIRFVKGVTHMDGKTALKFVRSRMGTNKEGSDFARSRRQQLVIEAFKEKVLSLGTLTNPQKISGLISTLGESLESDIPLDQYLKLYNFAKDIKSIESVVLGDLGKGETILDTGSPSKYGGYVLIPPDEDFSKVHSLIKQKLEEQASTSPKPIVTPSPTPTPRPARNASPSDAGRTTTPR